jgi:hypothetical protein
MRLGALEIDGRYRTLETAFTLELLRMMVLTLRAQGISIDLFRDIDVINEMVQTESAPVIVIHHIISKFASPVAEQQGFWCLNKQECCILLANVILKKYQVICI